MKDLYSIRFFLQFFHKLLSMLKSSIKNLS